MLACGDDDGNIQLWDLKDEKFVPRKSLKGHQSAVVVLEFDPTGKVLASGDLGSAVQVRDVSGAKAGEPVVLQEPGEVRSIYWTSAVLSLSFSPDGKHLAASSNVVDEGLPIEHVATRTVWQRINLPRCPMGVTFAPYGKHLATANPNGTAYVLRLPDR